MTRTMNHAMTGALAAAVGAVLLLGGAGTLAYWNDDEAVPGGAIASGELKLGTPVCGAWLLDGATTYTTGMLIVPGDELTKVCTIDLIATGEHLGATLGITTAAFTGPAALTDELAASAVFTINGVTKTTITEADATGTGEISATLEVTFDGEGATNASQALTATLNSVTVTATQTHSS